MRKERKGILYITLYILYFSYSKTEKYNKLDLHMLLKLRFILQTIFKPSQPALNRQYPNSTFFKFFQKCFQCKVCQYMFIGRLWGWEDLVQIF